MWIWLICTPCCYRNDIKSNRIDSNWTEPNGIESSWSGMEWNGNEAKVKKASSNRFEWSSNISLEIDVVNSKINEYALRQESTKVSQSQQTHACMLACRERKKERERDWENSAAAYTMYTHTHTPCHAMPCCVHSGYTLQLNRKIDRDKQVSSEHKGVITSQ